MARRVRDPHARQRIVEAAWRLVAARGTASSTMRAVATEAGVSTGSVTHYFEDKVELMDAVLAYNNEQAAEQVRRAVGQRRGLEAAERATLAVLPVDRTRLGLWQVWLGFWAHEPDALGSGSGLAEGYRSWTGILREHLSQAVEDGELAAGIDTRHETSVLATVVAGTGLLTGSEMVNQKRARTRARRIVREQFEALADKNRTRTRHENPGTAG